MSEILTITTDEVVPDREAVFEHQGIPAGRAVAAEIEALCTAAMEVFRQAAAPAGVLAEISKADFATLYKGDGQNEDATPVDEIYPRAKHLALFAVTVGEEVSRRIADGFKSKDFVDACMLDSVASASAERAVEIVQQRFLERATARSPAATKGEHRRLAGVPTGETPVPQFSSRAEKILDISSTGGDRRSPVDGVLAYSPGYCGWDISGQRKLFEFLKPETVGISLGESCLMQPLKSVSGVFIIGPKAIHLFDNCYSFCGRCTTHNCRDRIRALDAGG